MRLWCRLALGLAALSAVPSSTKAVTKTHGMMLDSVATMVAADLLRDVPSTSGRGVMVTLPVRGDTLGVLAQRLVERLRAQGVPVHVAGRGVVKPDSGESGIVVPDRPYEMGIRVDGSGVSYLRRIRSFPFGVKGYERLAALRASLTMIDPKTGEVVWARSSSGSAVDVVRKRDLAAAVAGSGGINPPVPPGGGFRLLEPLIVLGVVSGLIVLFYSNRT
jgi:hypothetical protein